MIGPGLYHPYGASLAKGATKPSEIRQLAWFISHRQSAQTPLGYCITAQYNAAPLTFNNPRHENRRAAYVYTYTYEGGFRLTKGTISQ